MIRSGHEVLVWPQREGVVALVGPTGPEKNTLQYPADGIHFRVVSHFVHPPAAPGAYRPGAFDGSGCGRGIRWGISMKGGPDPYLVRFECNLEAPARRRRRSRNARICIVRIAMLH